MKHTKRSLEYVIAELTKCLNDVTIICKVIIESTQNEDISEYKTKLWEEIENLSDALAIVEESSRKFVDIAKNYIDQPYKSPVGSSTTVSPSGDSKS